MVRLRTYCGNSSSSSFIVIIIKTIASYSTLTVVH
jgi:hypothetical protein